MVRFPHCCRSFADAVAKGGFVCGPETYDVHVVYPGLFVTTEAWPLTGCRFCPWCGTQYTNTPVQPR